MSKVAIISDIHWGVKNSSEYFLNLYNDYFENHFFPCLEREQIKHCIIGGDFWENRKSINVLSFISGLNFLQEFHKRGIEVYIIIGNHDVFYKNTNDYNSIDWMKNLEGVNICPNTMTVEINGVHFGLVNWVNDSNKSQIEAFINAASFDVLVGHFEVVGFEMQHNYACSEGYKIEEFKSIPLVFSGHFHIHAQKQNVVYIGNHIQTNWGEINDDKGFIVYDTATKTWERRINPIQVYKEFIYDPLNPINFDDIQNKYVRLWSTANQFYDPDFTDFLDTLKSVCHQVQHQIINEFSDTDLQAPKLQSLTIPEMFNDHITIYPSAQQERIQARIKVLHDESLKELNL